MTLTGHSSGKYKPTTVSRKVLFLENTIFHFINKSDFKSVKGDHIRIMI